MSAAISVPLPRSWLSTITRTADDHVALGLRLVLAGVMFPHGAQHLTGWFGGFGYAGTHAWMTGALGIPAPLATLAIVVEFFAPLALLVGAFGRIAALGLGALLAVAASTHAANGFFMNWIGKNAGEGFEYHLLAIALAAAVVVRGSGSWSVDRRL
jgi:putative oxidoreductase